MRALKLLVIVMGLLIVIGFTALIVIIVGRITHPGEGKSQASTSSQPFAAAPIELRSGARIEAMAVGPDRLVLNVALPNGERELVVIETATGRRLGSIPVHIAP